MKSGLVVALLWLALPAQAGTLDVRVPQDGGFAPRVTSLKEARFARTIRQQYDYSCGSAALATLLTYHYGQPVREREVFAHMYERGDRARIQKEGFSLLDMKRYLDTHGYAADGFQQPVERLAQQSVPAIVLLSERGYRHFVVVKGIDRGRVLLGDPATGTRAVSLERFRALWTNGVLFVVHNRRERARFNAAADWFVAPAARLDLAVGRENVLDTLPLRTGGI
jgi:uncharacterized protein